MIAPAPGGRWRRLLVDGPGLAAVAAVASAVTLWEVPTRGAAALDVAPVGLALAYFGVLAGRLVVGALRLPAARFGDIPTVVLVGFLTLNVLFLGAALALPLALPVDALLIAAGLVAWALWADLPAGRSASSGAGLACLGLSLLAATLWSVDSIEPTTTSRGVVSFAPWVDSYTHACFIRVFRDARGIGSLEHFSLAGEPTPPYHYASFLAPALLAATSGASCYLAFAAFMVPLGMALVGLAAFVLGRWWFGPGAGLAATAGVLLIPDASRYGIANPYLGFHWLLETGPTMMYGVAAVAVAWVLVFEGCRAGRVGLVATGFVVAGLSVLFKAHVFVANAFLVWVYPAFFCRGPARRARLAWFAFSMATFGLAAWLSWRFPGVPLLKLDGSALRSYLGALASNLDDSLWRRIFLVGPESQWSRAVLKGLVHLTFGTLGAFAVALPVLIVAWLRSGREGDRAARVEVALFPVLVTTNYLVMALGLALDDRTNHMPDELLHRPLVWAYFAVTAWSVGCFSECVVRPRLARPGPTRVLVAVAAVVLLGVPAYFGRGVQVGPEWGKQYTALPIPTGFVRCAEFLRDRSARGEVVQDSAADPWNTLGALAERPVYVADTWRTGKQTDPRIVRRLDEMARFRALIDPSQVAEFAARRRIAWYVLDPAARTRWPASILARPAFEAGGFRVYRFPPPG